MNLDDAEAILFRAWERVSTREHEVGFDGLGHAERVFVAIWNLETEVNNGGFDQYLFNSSGDHARFVLDALREVGAGPIADICEQVYGILPGGAPATERDERQGQLEAAEQALGEAELMARFGALEQRFYALEDGLRELLVAYVRAHGLA